MLQSGLIEASTLAEKVKQLKQYGSAQIRDYEKAVFSAIEKGLKGLDKVSEGTGTPLVQHAEKASMPSTPNEELSKKLVGMFRMTKANNMAAETESLKVNKAMGR